MKDGFMHDYNKLHKIWHQAHLVGSPTKFVRNQVVFKKLSQLIPGNTLDVGCGTGEYSSFLAKAGHHVTAFDPSSFAIETFKSTRDRFQINCEINTIENFESSFLFDNIISIEVIEHIKSDRAFLRKLHGLLKKNGSIIISAPATPFLFSEADKVSGHYRRYSFKILSNILNDAGFTNIRITRYGFPMLFIYSLLRKFFLDKLLIHHFESSGNSDNNRRFLISKLYPLLLAIDHLDKPLWSIGYVAQGNKP